MLIDIVRRCVLAGYLQSFVSGKDDEYAHLCDLRLKMHIEELAGHGRAWPAI